MSLRGYARVAAGVFVVIGLAGFVFGSVGYSGFFGPGVPENFMHLLVGLLFAYFGFSSRTDDGDVVRYFVGGMGVLLLAGKGLLLAGNMWGGQSAFGTVTEVLCIVAGVASVLAARYLR